MSFTKCCNLRYMGENHNPVYEMDGKKWCVNCGWTPEVEKLRLQLKEAHKVINFAYDNEIMDTLECLKAIQKKALNWLKNSEYLEVKSPQVV